MPFSTGSRLGSYEIVGVLGTGGMGEVYRARDRTLDRDVAIKVLPDALAADPDRIARFEREAKTLAALNHPHIALVYGLEWQDGSDAGRDRTSTPFIVMELVDGSTLADRIAQGPIAIEDALPIAKQIADALEAAHEQNIIHRDLKPANVKVRLDGVVKVLDFGLAKAFDPAVASGGVPSMSPTLSVHATQAGVILGTAAYMAPEQARGRAVDKRADIWAFGVVLFEMLTGTRPFEGDDVSVTLASVIKSDPDWTALPQTVPPALRRLVKRCLEKDPRERLRDIGEVRIEIDRISSGGPDEFAAPAVTAAGSPPPSQPRVPWIVSATAVIAAITVLALWAPWRPVKPLLPVRVSTDLGVDASINLLANVTVLGAAAVPSPDGTLLAFVAQKGAAGRPELHIRRLDQLLATALPGTSGATSPFFSPDGRWLAFFAEGKLKKISVTGGAAVTVCDAQAARGGSWAEDGTIVFSATNRSPLMRVPAAGGKPEPVGALADGEVLQRWPQVLPGGRAVLFTSHSSVAGFDEANLVVQSLPVGSRKVVHQGGHFGRYVASGHLVYVHGGTLFAAPFDLARLETTGPPVPVLDSVASNAAVAGSAQFATSENGLLVFVPGKNLGSQIPMSWLSRDGKTTPLRSAPADWTNVHIAPDGRRVAMDIYDGRTRRVGVRRGSRELVARDLRPRRIGASSLDARWPSHRVQPPGQDGQQSVLAAS